MCLPRSETPSWPNAQCSGSATPSLVRVAFAIAANRGPSGTNVRVARRIASAGSRPWRNAITASTVSTYCCACARKCAIVAGGSSSLSATRAASSSAISASPSCEKIRRNSSIAGSAWRTSRSCAAACWRRKPVRYAVAGYGVFSCVIGGVRRRMRNAYPCYPAEVGSATMRLNKYLGESGQWSRREADTLIEEGRVTINGVPAGLGAQVAGGGEVKVDGGIVGRARELGRPEGMTKRCKVRVMGPKLFSIILSQVLNRQIRRMCEALGYDVVALQRVRFMNVLLGTLAIGRWRNLTQQELDGLRPKRSDAAKKPQPPNQHARPQPQKARPGGGRPTAGRFDDRRERTGGFGDAGGGPGHGRPGCGRPGGGRPGGGRPGGGRPGGGRRGGGRCHAEADLRNALVARALRRRSHRQVRVGDAR